MTPFNLHSQISAFFLDEEDTEEDTEIPVESSSESLLSLESNEEGNELPKGRTAIKVLNPKKKRGRKTKKHLTSLLRDKLAINPKEVTEEDEEVPDESTSSSESLISLDSDNDSPTACN